MNLLKLRIFAAFIIGLAFGCLLMLALTPSTYELRPVTGVSGVVAKLNKRTGQMWIISGTHEYPVKNNTISQ